MTNIHLRWTTFLQLDNKKKDTSHFIAVLYIYLSYIDLKSSLISEIQKHVTDSFLDSTFSRRFVSFILSTLLW